MRFSERLGFKPVRSVLQIDSMDDALRNGLWNVVYEEILIKINGNLYEQPSLHKFFINLWRDFLKLPIDTVPGTKTMAIMELKELFFGYSHSVLDIEKEGLMWYEIYDLIEFIAQNYPFGSNKRFKDSVNKILKRELSAYRFVDDYLVRITDDEEIQAIEEVLKSPLKIDYAKQHIQQALALLADKQAPDYRNSIKESISAVEAIGKIISNQPSSTLGAVLKQLEKKTNIELHPTLKQAFEKLYGYTSDANGIRHALKDDSNIDYEEAKYMLVACSAFVNYLAEKAIKTGIDLQ
ncbi:AbiJ-NTD4 domain-containing protein [Parageobacillus thermoglucosidasius]|uniref:AbiJ-NTD4 domain-containing protein n=1 Tax=Parageobacillus thermoglucosidasius TaxID=1426 RepID=UPI003B67CCFD